MKSLIVLAISAFAVCGCANDQYTGAGSRAALHDCKHEVLAADVHERYKDGGGAVIAASLVGGAIGGAAVGAVAHPAPDGDKLNAAIEACMARKGYIGTSN